MARRYHREQAVHAYYWNGADEGETQYVDCDSGYPKYTVIDPDGTVEVDAQAMTKTEEGKYKYEDYNVPNDGKRDWWNEKIEARTNTKITIVFDGFGVI